MADITEKNVIAADVDHVDDEKHKVAAIKVLIGNESFNQAYLKEPPIPFNWIAIQLYMISIVGFCCSTSNGFDSSMFGNLLANNTFLNYFNVGSVGIQAGIVSSMNQIGSVVAIPFIGPALDTWGRKAGMFIGGAIIIIATIIQGTCIHNPSNPVGQFMGGRFLMGAGIAIIASAGPCYVIEVSHPAYRGVVTGFYNVFWPVGALVASSANRGCVNLAGNASWLIPVWIQMMFPGIVFVAAFFLPESPRWNYCNGKRDKAKAFLTKYHGNGNPESEWVKLQMMEYEAHLELEGADKRWWDYRALFRDRASIYRLLSNCFVSLFGQWAGNGPVSYFLSGVLGTAGVTNATIKADLFAAMNAVQCIFSFTGAAFVDRWGRRPMLIWVNIGCSICWIGVTAAAGTYAQSMAANPNSPNKAASAATVAFIYIFQVVYSVGWTPMQALYPVEVLSFEMRAKGMAFSNMFVTIGTMVNQFGFPVALQNLGWKTYPIFLIWCLVQAFLIWLFIPETKNRTLEELDEIFHAKNPRNESIKKRRLELDADANVIGIQDVEGKDESAA